jgi:tetratricopeptide (TPR) repeat protein
MLTPQDITELLAGFYARWALKKKGPDMVLVAELIEDMRPALEKQNAYDVWDYLPIDTEKYGKDLCKMALLELRQNFFELLFDKQFTTVQQLAATEPANASRLLRQYFAEALVHYREDFICLLLKQDLPLGNSFEVWKKTIDQIPLLLRESRWVDLYPFFQNVYNDISIGVNERCLAETISGLIVLYTFPVFTPAEKHFKNALELQPDHLIPKRGMGELYLKQGKIQNAREVFLEVINKQCKDYTSYNLVGDTFFEETKVKLEQNTTLSKDLLTNEEYWYNEGWHVNFLQTESCRRLISMYSYNRTIFDANKSKIPALMKAAEQTDWYPEKKRFRFIRDIFSSCFYDTNYYHICRDLAGNYRGIDDFTSAEKLFKETIQSNPQLTPAYIDLGYAYMKEKNFEAAKEQLDKALALEKNNYDALWNLAYYYEEMKMKAEAISIYEICKKLRPSWSDSINNFIGNVYYDYEEFEKAIPYYRDSMNQNPEYNIYKDNLILAYQKLVEQKEKTGNIDDVAELHKQIIALTNAHLDWNKLGNLYFRYKRYNEAATCYAKAMELLPEEPVYHENLGLAYKNQGLLDKAAPQFLEAVKINTRDGESLNQLGVFYLDQQQYDEALIWFRKALEKNANSVDFNMNIGFALEKKAAYDSALPYYEQAAKEDPHNSTIQNRIGLVYYSLNDHPKAIEYFKKAAELDPGIPVYLENVASSYTLLDNKEEAENYYQKAIALNTTN